ncbi:MAG: SBBP repeat-containing protein [Bacteroidota bacterium]
MIKHFIISILTLLSTLAFSQTLNWTQSVDGSKGLSITTDLKGNIYTTGYFSGSPDFDHSAGSYTLACNGQSDVFITKHDSTGSLIWAKALGSLYGDEGNSITLDASGNLLITGIFTGTVDFDPHPASSYVLSGNTFFESIFILKLDNNGNFTWAKIINGYNSSSTGRSITADRSKNVYVAGCFSNSTDFDPGINADTLKNFGNWDAYILKLDSSGNYMWAKNIGPSTANTEGNCVTLDASENIYLTGTYEGSSDFNPGSGVSILNPTAYSDIYVLKLDLNGNYIWAKKLGGSGLDKSNALLIDARKNVYTTGFFEGTSDFNPHVVATYTLNTTYGLNSFISKLDSSGNFVWAKNIGRNLSNNTATSLAKDRSNNLYITGCYMNTTDFDPGPDSFYVYMSSINSNNAAYILKLDSLGNFMNVKAFGTGAYGAFGQGITIDMNDHVLTTGYFSGTGDFDPDSMITHYLSSSGSTAAYISRFSGGDMTVGTKEMTNSELYGIKCYPNPSHGKFKVVAKEKIKLSLIDNLGRIIQVIDLNESNHFQQNIEALSAGIYFISGQAEKGSVSQKIIVTQ